MERFVTCLRPPRGLHHSLRVCTVWYKGVLDWSLDPEGNATPLDRPFAAVPIPICYFLSSKWSQVRWNCTSDFEGSC